MREAIMSGNWHFTSISKLNDSITAARKEAEDEARKFYPSVRDRGYFLATADCRGPCRPREEADDDVSRWRRTWAEVVKLVADVEAKHPHVMKVYISGGYDGAGHHYRWTNGEYEPWVESWNVTIWERA
jgi:hypothetical protein